MFYFVFKTKYNVYKQGRKHFHISKYDSNVVLGIVITMNDKTSKYRPTYPCDGIIECGDAAIVGKTKQKA